MVLFGGFTLTLGPVEVRAHSYTNPLLVLTGLIGLRLWLRGSLARLGAQIRTPTDAVTQLRERVSLAMRRIRAQAQLMAILASVVVGVVAATPYLLHGLTRSYYDNSEWLGPPATTVRDGTLRLEGSDFPWYGSWYSVEWTGMIYIPAGGVYRFALASDDASRLWIDEILVVDNVGTHPTRTVDGRANLAPGFRRIRLRYRQQQGGVTFSASWRREPSGERREAEAPLATAMLFQRQPGPGMFAIYRVGRSLVAAGGAVLLVALVCIGGGVWVLARRRLGRPWPAAGGHAVRRWAVRALLVVGSLSIALAGAEVALRIVYRDNGRTTSDGPGDSRFAYTFPPWSTNRVMRGPSANGPKAPGVTRVLVQGDSITWGQGVSDWTQVYPARLLEKLRETGAYDMTVLAKQGEGIDGHLARLEQEGERLAPDVIIYQWFVNDVVLYPWFLNYLEAGGRPWFDQRWRQWRYHETARERSFLYWLLYRRASDIVGSRLYADYARHLARDGSPQWQLFRTQFHRWATRATAKASRVFLLQYPTLPFRGMYPLGDVHQRMATAAGASVWSQPAYAAAGRVGTNAAALDSRYGVVRRSGPGVGGELAAFHDLPFRRGQHEVTFWLRLMNQATGTVARVEVSRENENLVERRILANHFAALGEWEAFTLRFDVEGELIEDVSLRVVAQGRGGIEVSSVDLTTDYGIEVVDAIPYLRDLDTWASPFDAHPNARAHAVLADVLYERLSGTPRGMVNLRPRNAIDF